MNLQECYKLGVEAALREHNAKSHTKVAGIFGKSPQEESWDRLKGYAAGGGVVAGGSLGALGIAGAGGLAERKLSGGVASPEFTKKLRGAMRVPADVKIQEPPINLFRSNPIKESFLGSHFNPETKSVHVPKETVPKGILAHELGHASGKVFLGKNVQGVSRLLGGSLGVPISLIAQMYTDPDSTATKAFRYAPGAIMAPALIEEIRASAKGLRGLSRVGGKGAALKGLLSTLPGFASYAAMAAAPIYGGKAIHHFTKD